jgi:hypothetical protein
LIVFDVIDEFGMSPEVVDVDGGSTRYHDLKLFFIEDFNQPMWDEIVEPFEEGFELSLDAGGHLGI